MNCLSVFDHFVGLALKGLNSPSITVMDDLSIVTWFTNLSKLTKKYPHDKIIGISIIVYSTAQHFS